VLTQPEKVMPISIQAVMTVICGTLLSTSAGPCHADTPHSTTKMKSPAPYVVFPRALARSSQDGGMWDALRKLTWFTKVSLPAKTMATEEVLPTPYVYRKIRLLLRTNRMELKTEPWCTAWSTKKEGLPTITIGTLGALCVPIRVAQHTTAGVRSVVRTIMRSCTRAM